MKSFGVVILSLLFVNLPTLVFELRHRFVLTKMLLFGEKLKQGQLGIIDKLFNLYL